MAGIIADEGGDFRVVVESIVLLVVESVVMVCAFTMPRYINDKTINTNLFICTSILLFSYTKYDKISNNFIYL